MITVFKIFIWRVISLYIWATIQHTINSDFFVRILFSWIALKDMFARLNTHDYGMIFDRVVLPFAKGVLWKYNSKFTVMYTLACAYTEDLNQSTHPHSPLRVFVFLLKKHLTFGYTYSAHWRLAESAVWLESSMSVHANLYLLMCPVSFGCKLSFMVMPEWILKMLFPGMHPTIFFRKWKFSIRLSPFFITF